MDVPDEQLRILGAGTRRRGQGAGRRPEESRSILFALSGGEPSRLSIQDRGMRHNIFL